MFELRPVRRNAISSYNPFREMENFERSFFSDPFFFSDNGAVGFKTDISVDGDNYVLESDLPGFSKDDINIDINGDTLTISAERKSDNDEKDANGKYIRRERTYGSYVRSFDVSGIDTDNINAEYTDGVLKITMPKLQETAPASRRLEIH